MRAVKKEVESGKTDRVLLAVATSLLTLPRPRAVPFALDAIAGPRLWGVEEVCGVNGDDRFSSETTRACENPHTPPDAVAVGAHRCAPAHYIGCVGVPRRVEACC